MNVNNHSSEQKGQFVFNILLGVAVTFFFLLMKDTAVRQSFINEWFDRYIAFRADSETDTWRAAQSIVFLDFDNKSFRTLGRPDLTPRDKVAELLKVAYEGKARAVVLDMNFSEADYSPAKTFEGEEIAKSGVERDRELFDLIDRIKNDSESKTTILLPLMTYADGTIKDNIFSSLIDNRKVFEVTPTFSINGGGDNATRFWSPYLEAKDAATNESKILWSIPLMSAMIYVGAVDELDGLKPEILDTDKNMFETTPITFYRERAADGGVIRDATSMQYNRIQYAAIPAGVLEKYPFGTISPENIGHWRKNGLDNGSIDCRDKIVMIGRADEDCADFFSTPVGNFSGMYVHGNAVASILGETRPHLTSIYKHALIELILVVIAAYAFLGLSEFKAKCVVFGLTGLCWLSTYV